METTQEVTKRAFYKRWWFWVLAVIVILMLISMNGSSTTPEKVSGNDSGSQPSGQNAAQTSYKVDDQIKLGSSIIRVNSVQYSRGGQFTKPQEGNEWVNINLTIQNTSSSQQYVTTLGQMFVRDGASNSYQIAVTDKLMENPNNSLDGAIIANSKRTGWIGFEIPKGATGLQFQYNGSMWGGGNILVDLGR